MEAREFLDACIRVKVCSGFFGAIGKFVTVTVAKYVKFEVLHCAAAGPTSSKLTPYYSLRAQVYALRVILGCKYAPWRHLLTRNGLGNEFGAFSNF